VRDSELITPAHLLYGRKITTLPHYSTNLDDDLDDPVFGNASDLQRQARSQAIVVDLMETGIPDCLKGSSQGYRE